MRLPPSPRTGGHLDIAVEDQISVESSFLQVYNAHLFERMPQRSNEIPDQIMGQRTWRLDALLLQRDSGSLRLADPDRQVSITVGLAQ